MVTTEQNLRLWQRLLLVFLWAWLLVFFLWWYIAIAKPAGALQDIAFTICIEAGRPWVGYIGDTADNLGLLRSGWMMLLLPLGTALNTFFACAGLALIHSLIRYRRAAVTMALMVAVGLQAPARATPSIWPQHEDLAQSCEAGHAASCASFLSKLESSCQKKTDYDMACFVLGTLLQKGNKVMAPEPAKALPVLQRACEAGLTKACVSAGWLAQGYESGTPDLPLAHKLFTKACESLDNFSCYILGEFYRLGRGVKRDPVESFKWHLIASNLGNKQSPEAIEKLALSAAQYKQARQRLQAWCKSNGC